MKKTFLPLFFLLLASSLSVFALAEEIDLSVMTDNELLILAAKVNDEIEKRSISTTASMVPSGTYYVGKDLKPGTYKLTLSELVNYASRGMYYLYNSQDDLDNKKPLNSSTVELGKDGRVTVEEGQVLTLHYGTWLMSEDKLPFAP